MFPRVEEGVGSGCKGGAHPNVGDMSEGPGARAGRCGAAIQYHAERDGSS
jgi:hypothetical protein